MIVTRRVAVLAPPAVGHCCLGAAEISKSKKCRSQHALFAEPLGTGHFWRGLRRANCGPRRVAGNATASAFKTSLKQRAPTTRWHRDGFRKQNVMLAASCCGSPETRRFPHTKRLASNERRRVAGIAMILTAETTHPQRTADMRRQQRRVKRRPLRLEGDYGLSGGMGSQVLSRRILRESRQPRNSCFVPLARCPRSTMRIRTSSLAKERIVPRPNAARW